MIDQSIRLLLNESTADQLYELQQQVFADDEYDPSAAVILQWEARLVTQRNDEADVERLLQELDVAPWIWQLCPRYHFLRARTLLLLQEHAGADEAVGHMQGVLKAILATGDGTKNAPFRPTYVTDEQDILMVIGERIRCRQLVFRSGRQCDVVTAHSGDDVWFDVTPLVQQAAKLGESLAFVAVR